MDGKGASEMRKIGWFTLVILLIGPACYAEDIFIAQNPLGGNSGSNCSNARGVDWFNSASNWGAGEAKISAGDTVHLCGVISTALTIQGSGTATQKITVRFETGAKLSAPHWGSQSGAVNGTDRHHMIIDGGANGVIESTANGTSRAYAYPSIGINLNRCNGWEIKNLTIRDIYARTPNSADSNRGSRGLLINDCDNINVNACSISGAEYGMRIGNQSKPSDSIRIYGNRLTDFATAVVVACDAASDITNVTVDNNEIIGSLTWEGSWGPSDWHHRDGIHTWTGGGATGTNHVDFCNNYIHGPFGSSTTQTAYIFYASSTVGKIYNNVVAPTEGVPNHGFVYLVLVDGETLHVQIYNNTFVSLGSGAVGKYAISMAGKDVPKYLTVYNNVFTNFYFAYYDMTGTDMRLAKWDYNCYYNMSALAVSGKTIFANLSAWKNYLGGGADREGSSLWANPVLQANYRPAGNSPLIDAGKNLGGIFNVDKDGTPRPQGVAWDIGAYERRVTSAPASPDNLRVVEAR
jgi:hypothetical protein